MLMSLRRASGNRCLGRRLALRLGVKPKLPSPNQGQNHKPRHKQMHNCLASPSLRGPSIWASIWRPSWPNGQPSGAKWRRNGKESRGANEK